jgi:hypothetical protein
MFGSRAVTRLYPLAWLHGAPDRRVPRGIMHHLDCGSRSFRNASLKEGCDYAHSVLLAKLQGLKTREIFSSIVMPARDRMKACVTALHWILRCVLSGRISVQRAR